MNRADARLRRSHHAVPAVVIALSLMLGMLAVLPMGTTAQDDSPQSLEGPRWQLLEYRDDDGSLELVPPGIGATALMWFDVIKGAGACSTYESGYTLQKDVLLFNQDPVIDSRGCDPEGQRIDDAFYRGLTRTASWSGDGSILELRDSVGDVVLTFTEAQLPSDPTIAPIVLAA